MNGRGPRSTESENKYARVMIGAGESARQHWRLILVAGGALMLILYGFEFLGGDEGVLKTRTLRQETAELTAQNENLKREKAALGAQGESLKLKNMESNPFLLEKLVRENRLLVRPGEVLYTFDETGQDKAAEGLPEVTIAQRPPKKEKDKKPD